MICLEYQSTTEEAARDIGAFVFMFFQHFVTFKGRAFHMRGESYGVSTLRIYVHLDDFSETI